MAHSHDVTPNSAGKARPTFVKELIKLWPALPYLGFGLWLAWANLAYSGTVWLSDIETNGSAIAFLYIMSTGALAVMCLIAPFILPLAKRMLSNRKVIIGAGLVAGAGCLLVILSGPFYFMQVLHNTWAIFIAGAVLSGIGTSFFALKFGEMLSTLAPRRVLLYVSLSQIVIVFLYFTVIGSPVWAPVFGGPSLVGILAFCLIPLLISVIATLYDKESNFEQEEVEYRESRKSLPAVFWRLIALSFLFPLVASVIKAMVVNESALAVTVESNNIVALFRVPLAILFIIIAIRGNVRHMNFGKLYSFIAVFMVVMIACFAAISALSSTWNILINCASAVFEFVMWCLLAFVVFQKRISPIIVFGFGQGAFMLGSTLGWVLGAFVLPAVIVPGINLAFYIICAGVVLVLSFVLFSEKDFERLFSPVDENELSFESLMEANLMEGEEKQQEK
ncbi:MAG: LuxR family transcriptional regulator, partial [Eggerthellaceae bacterium]|nr:LuxR family transcriptional regulator [Eggerthellaceae bacterium]